MIQTKRKLWLNIFSAYQKKRLILRRRQMRKLPKNWRIGLTTPRFCKTVEPAIFSSMWKSTSETVSALKDMSLLWKMNLLLEFLSIVQLIYQQPYKTILRRLMRTYRIFWKSRHYIWNIPSSKLIFNKIIKKFDYFLKTVTEKMSSCRSGEFVNITVMLQEI